MCLAGGRLVVVWPMTPLAFDRLEAEMHERRWFTYLLTKTRG
jgi:hypothetical protein